MLGPRRAAAGAAGRGDHRPGPGHPAATPRPSQLPAGKTFAAGDETRCSIPAATQSALRALEWIDQRENLCACGPSGTGKLLPVGEDAAEGFYRLVDACYETRPLAVFSNLHPAGFDELMPKTLATATVDRPLHHAHVCVTDGQSFRLAQATASKGVTPLPQGTDRENT